MTTFLPLSQFESALLAAVGARGTGYVYEKQPGTGSCYYRTPVLAEYSEDEFSNEYVEFEHSEGEPGCIFGFVFDALGVLPAELYDYDDFEHADDPAYVEGKTAGQALALLDLEILDDRTGENITGNVRYAADRAQQAQDSGRTWGDTVSEFSKVLTDELAQKANS